MTRITLTRFGWSLVLVVLLVNLWNVVHTNASPDVLANMFVQAAEHHTHITVHLKAQDQSNYINGTVVSVGDDYFVMALDGGQWIYYISKNDVAHIDLTVGDVQSLKQDAR